MLKQTPNKVCEVLKIHPEAQAPDNQDSAWTRYLVKAALCATTCSGSRTPYEFRQGRRVWVATLAPLPSDMWVNTPEMHFCWDHGTVPTKNQDQYDPAKMPRYLDKQWTNCAEMLQLWEPSGTHRLSLIGQKEGQSIPEGFSLALALSWNWGTESDTVTCVKSLQNSQDCCLLVFLPRAHERFLSLEATQGLLRKAGCAPGQWHCPREYQQHIRAEHKENHPTLPWTPGRAAPISILYWMPTSISTYRVMLLEIIPWDKHSQTAEPSYL